MSDALKQRAALEKQIAAAWDQYSKGAAARQTAEVELGRAKRALDDTRKRRAASKATDREVELAEERAVDAEGLLALHRERENSALLAAKSLDEDLNQLLRVDEYREAFIDQAEAVTQQARAALEGLRDPLRDAWEAWEAAERAWLPLCRAHRIEGVPRCPLPTADSVLDALPRPQAVKVGQN